MAGGDIILRNETHLCVPILLAKPYVAAKARLDEGDFSDEEQQWSDEVKRHRQRLHNSWVDEDHPGCQISGHLLLDRVPGNFHIQARSPHHDLVPHLTNVSHVVHSLSIGEPVVKTLIARGMSSGKIFVPRGLIGKMSPMDGNVYVTQDLHEAYHHYLKVVTTNVDGLKMGKRELKTYQIVQSSQLAMYRPDVVPEAKVCICDGHRRFISWASAVCLIVIFFLSSLYLTSLQLLSNIMAYLDIGTITLRLSWP
jgi:Endoplasmic reticulum vesicle transporter